MSYRFYLFREKSNLGNFNYVDKLFFKIFQDINLSWIGIPIHFFIT